MRSFESILKILFLGMGILLIANKSVYSTSFQVFLVVCLLLGIVLIFNKKHPSYKYPAKYKYNNRVIVMRRIEGCVLIAFTVVTTLVL